MLLKLKQFSAFHLARIILALSMLAEIITRLTYYEAFYTDQGFLLRNSAILEAFSMAPWQKIFFLSGNKAFVILVFSLQLIVTTSFLFNYKTRWSALLSWIFFQSMLARSGFAGDASNQLMGHLILIFILYPQNEPSKIKQFYLTIFYFLVYFLNGINKIASPLWQNLEILKVISEVNTLSSPLLKLLASKNFILKTISGVGLSLEIIAPWALLVSSVRIKRWLIIAMTIFHLVIILFMPSLLLFSTSGIALNLLVMANIEGAKKLTFKFADILTLAIIALAFSWQVEHYFLKRHNQQRILNVFYGYFQLEHYWHQFTAKEFYDSYLIAQGIDEKGEKYNLVNQHPKLFLDEDKDFTSKKIQDRFWTDFTRLIDSPFLKKYPLASQSWNYFCHLYTDKKWKEVRFFFYQKRVPSNEPYSFYKIHEHQCQ